MLVSLPSWPLSVISPDVSPAYGRCSTTLVRTRRAASIPSRDAGAGAWDTATAGGDA